MAPKPPDSGVVGWIREKLRVAAALSQIRWNLARARWSRARIRWRRARLRAEPWAILLALFVRALSERARMLRRRIARDKPRLVWGPVPITNIKYWSEAMRQRGYESMTCVSDYMAINRREDFDVYRDRFTDGSPASERLADYRFFTLALRQGDVFLRFFDGGFLRDTPLEHWEARLLHIAGKKLIVSPYGGDIAVAGHLGDAEDAMFADYPSLAENSEATKARVLESLECADLSIRNYQIGFLPSYDVIWPNQIAIDTAQWDGADGYSDSDGRNREVVVFHAPNHRRIKGTQHFEAAAEALKAEGLKIDLRILEGRPNEEIRAAMRDCDIVADQLLLSGYALFAIEAMASGKPVIANMSALPEALRETQPMRECPVVDADPSTVRNSLRRLVEDPTLRHAIGEAGRDFVLRHHSYEAVGREWEAILAHVWRGAPLRGHAARAFPATE